MGEIAEAMLTGQLCEMCGVPLCEECNKIGAELQVPLYCSKKCAKDRGVPKEHWEAAVCDH